MLSCCYIAIERYKYRHRTSLLVYAVRILACRLKVAQIGTNGLVLRVGWGGWVVFGDRDCRIGIGEHMYTGSNYCIYHMLLLHGGKVAPSF
jgi:hypothetical protein